MEHLNIYNKLMAEIGNAYGVCGLMGNLKAESAMRSDNLQDSGNRKLDLTDAEYVAQVDSGARNFVDNIGFGLAQWTSSGRKASLLAFAKERGKSIADEEMQVDFIIYELTNGYKAVLKKLKNATSVKEASDYVVKKYERPANQGESVLSARAKKGQAFYDTFAEKSEVKEPMVRRYKKGVKVQLAPNFKSTEFDCNGKGCCTETPIHDNLIMVLQEVRDHFGKSVKINSGYRCEVYNKKVSGASTNSKHKLGLAADIVVNKGKVHPMQVARYLENLFEKEGIKGRIGCYTYNDSGKGFVHVDVRGTDSRGLYTENNTDYDVVPSFSTSVKQGSKGRLVKVVQRKLRSEKLYFGLIDGKCGKGTTSAIMKFNAKHGRQKDASWGRKCWQEAFPY